MQKEYVIQFYKTINKLLCNLSFADQYISLIKAKYKDVVHQIYLHKHFRLYSRQHTFSFLLLFKPIDCFGITAGLTLIHAQYTSKGGGTNYNIFPQNDVKDNRYFIMTSFRRHICPPPPQKKVSPAVIPKRSIGHLMT